MGETRQAAWHLSTTKYELQGSHFSDIIKNLFLPKHLYQNKICATVCNFSYGVFISVFFSTLQQQQF